MCKKKTTKPYLWFFGGTMNLKFKITASYFGSQEILTAAHTPLGTSFFCSPSSYQCLSVKTLEKFCACN